MTTLTEQLRQALHGLAFADIGERCGRRAMHAALFPKTPAAEPALQAATGSPTQPPPQPSAQPATRSANPAASRKWIALGVGLSLPPHVMAYVIGTCRRMGADLLLVSRDGMATRELLAPYLPELAGIACQGEELTGQGGAAALLDRHRGVLFAVTGSEDDPLRPLLRPRRGARSPVPVVLVSPKRAGPSRSAALKAVGG